MTVAIASPGLEYQIQEIVESSLMAMGYRLVRISYRVSQTAIPQKNRQHLKRESAGGRLQLMVEQSNGTPFGIDDCGKVHRHVSALLNVADPIEQNFQLEVSSVGVARPLTKNSDFTDYSGHRVAITLIELHQGRRRFKGLLLQADDREACVQQDDGTVAAIPLEQVAEAHLQ